MGEWRLAWVVAPLVLVPLSTVVVSTAVERGSRPTVAFSTSAGPDDLQSRPRVVVPADDVKPTLGDAVPDDLRGIARDEGISLAEARRRYGWQGSFSRVVGAVANQFPDRFAGSSMRTTDPMRARIDVVGSFPAGLTKLVTGVPVPVTLVGGAPYSEEEIEQAVSAAHYAAWDGGRTGEVSTAFHRSSGSIRVTLYDEPAASRAARDARVEAARAAVDDELVRVGLDIPVDLVRAGAGGVVPERARAPGAGIVLR